MRTLLKIVVMAALLAGFQSCNYLDVVPDEQGTEKDAFEDTDAARRFLYSCYAYLPEPRWAQGSLDLLTGDEAITAFEHETFANFAKGNYSASNITNLISYWDTFFQGLRQCYILLNHINEVPQMAEDTKKDYVAQCKFLIAYYHFMLTRSYGSVILVKEEPSLMTPPSAYQARVPYDECVEFICNLFDEAAKDLPATRPQTQYGLATSVAAKSLKAKMLLYAASPLFNGDPFYADMTNKDGVTKLMPSTPDPNKWNLAKTAYAEAITAAEAAGARLYEDTDYTDMGNLEPTDSIQHRLRYTIIEPGNPEILFADCREENAYGIQNKSMPYSGNSAWNGIAPTLTMVNRFYTKRGLPIDMDPAFDKSGMYDVVTVGEEDAKVADKGAKTLKMNLKREPRFYAWIAFQAGFYEVMSSPDNNGAYKNDESYAKYLVGDNQAKLVCDFVLGGNTSRRTKDDTNQRTNNYSPSGFLNKKGIVPGYTVKTQLSGPPQYPWPLIRLAELYLSYAEACVEANDLTTARIYLNKVRVRAGIPAVEVSWAGIATLDQARLREVVRQERMIEFYLENQNFWDIRRWKMGEKYFNVKARGLNINASTIDDFAKETEVVFERKFGTYQYFMPIPAADVNKNMNLVQNKGY